MPNSRAAIGDAVWGRAPARPPKRGVLEGARVRLVPVDPVEHLDPLYACSHDGAAPNLWTYLFDGPFEDREKFGRYLRRIAESPTDVFYTVVPATGGPSGIASYLRIVPEHGVIEIGHIWFGSHFQRSAGATEAIYLLARHAFDDLGYRRLEWKCDALNERSRRAALRFGFVFEGVFRQHMVIKGRNRDTAWFAMLDQDWPRARQAFETWLAPENFDGAGRQKRRLNEIRERSINP